MQVNSDGIEFIKQLEGFRALPYQCSAGKWTIGYGHTEGVTKDTKEVNLIDAENLLLEDIEEVEETLNHCVALELSQNEFNALASLVFNIGKTKFLYSTLIRKLNAHDKLGASKEFLKWVYERNPETKEPVVSKGLKFRREKEQALFLEDITSKKNQAGSS